MRWFRRKHETRRVGRTTDVKGLRDADQHRFTSEDDGEPIVDHPHDHDERRLRKPT